MTVLKRLPMSKRLKEIVAAEANMPCGLGTIPRVPTGGPGSETKPAAAPYFIEHPLWTNTSGPPLGAPDADSEWVFQFDLVSERTDQLEWMRDKLLEVFLARGPSGAFLVPIVVPGMTVIGRTLKEDAGSDPAGSESAKVLVSQLRFGLNVTPADT